MPESQTFWSVEHEQGQPDFFVCMTCLSEVFRSQFPAQGCPACGAFSSYEAFTLEDIQTWGTEELIQKAQQLAAQSPASQEIGNPEEVLRTEESPS